VFGLSNRSDYWISNKRIEFFSKIIYFKFYSYILYYKQRSETEDIRLNAGLEATGNPLLAFTTYKVRSINKNSFSL
jgi:hypothetical protein